MVFVSWKKLKREARQGQARHACFTCKGVGENLSRGFHFSPLIRLQYTLRTFTRMGWHELLWIVRLLLLMQLVQGVFSWGKLGHYAVCKIAEGHLTEDAMATVKELLPDSAKGELASVCSWPDDIKWYYNWQWTTSLHYVDTPNFKCNYKYVRDCYDSAGHKNNCVTGAIFNYTRQLFSAYQRYNPRLKYNLTESLMFLAHYMADVHQPLHVGFTGDLGGTVKTFYGSDLLTMIPAIQRNITDAWSNDKSSWEYCIYKNTVCPNIYASESVRLACKYAYRNATPGSTLEDDYFLSRCPLWRRDELPLPLSPDDYFLSRLPVVEKRLAQGGIRLASVLNRLFNFRVKIGRSSR
ncbi:Endonuclease 3 [Hibiscus syriacus]|uniref:Aspergillus nuclease S1 n=1 Tax=Hibiscus syriacus TaxID=106335 RepID=A0A6A2ZEQ7_HIBSY|nr:Endonuclease 3 [Hibiscus syriacus]